jgi:hypothetical protein
VQSSDTASSQSGIGARDVRDEPLVPVLRSRFRARSPRAGKRCAARVDRLGIRSDVTGVVAGSRTGVCLDLCGANDAQPDQIDVAVSPNPGGSLVTGWFQNCLSLTCSLRIEGGGTASAIASLSSWD